MRYWSHLAALACLTSLVACGKGRGRQPQVTRDASRPHDETSHNENHYFVAVTATGFEPTTLEVPLDRDVIVLFVRHADSPCERVVLEQFGGTMRTVELVKGSPTEVHVRFGGGGTYTCESGSGTRVGTFKPI